MLLHASCIAINRKAVLLTGSPGTGKSDLALRLVDQGAALVADDQTDLSLENGILVASPPESIEGLLEIRHIGLVQMPWIASVPVALCVGLSPSEEKLERMPKPDTVLLLDRPIRRVRLPAFAASTPAKIRAILTSPSNN